MSYADPLAAIVAFAAFLVVLGMTATKRPKIYSIYGFLLLGGIRYLCEVVPPSAIYKINETLVQLTYQIWDISLVFAVVITIAAISGIIEARARLHSQADQIICGIALLSAIAWDVYTVAALWRPDLCGIPTLF